MEIIGYYFLFHFGRHITDKSLIIIIFANIPPKVGYVEFLGDKSTMHIRVTLH